MAAVMRVIAKPALIDFYSRHSRSKGQLLAWWKTAGSARWASIVDVRKNYPAADAVGRLTVFNVGGNEFRLIVRIDYAKQINWIRYVLTPAEYDKEEWKHDPWY